MPRNRKGHDPKLETLLELGTVHAHPEQVRDPLFLGNEFFDSRDLVQVRYEMLRRVRVEGHSITDTAAAFGLSRQSFYEIQDSMEREGITGLLPRKRGPRHARKLNGDAMVVVAAELEREPNLAATALARRLAERLGLQVHPRSIERALQRQEKKLRPTRRSATARPRPKR